MDLEAVGGIAMFLGSVGAGAYAGWRARRSEAAANKAAQHAYPISNGWGTALREDMAKTLRAVERIGEAQLLAERRELGRDERLQDIADGLAAHIAHHGQETTV